MTEVEVKRQLWAAIHNSSNKGCITDLCDQELGDSLWQFAFLTGQNHLQHVTVQLLHDDKHPLWGFKHTLQVDDAGMMQILRRDTKVSWVWSGGGNGAVGLQALTWSMATSFLSWLSCLVGNLILSITFMATSLPLFLCLPEGLDV